MSADLETIKNWLERGRIKGATHVVIKCDTFDWSDYPHYVFPQDDVHKVADNLPPMTNLVEVYSLTGKHSIENQLKEFGAFHYD